MNYCPFCGSQNIRDRAVTEGHLPGNMYYRCNRCGVEWSNRPSIEYLTELEMKCISLLTQAAYAGFRVIKDAGSWDGIEWAQRIHACQHMIMAQAAARAYPDSYNLLGRTDSEPQEGE